MPDTKPERPDDRISVNLLDTDGKEIPRELFMSGGLVRHLANMTTSLGDFSELYANAQLQNILMHEVLRPRSDRGKPLGDSTLLDFEMSTAETDKLLGWLRGHILYFFTSTTQAMIEASGDKGLMESLVKSLESVHGSAASPQPKASAGASTA